MVWIAIKIEFGLFIFFFYLKTFKKIQVLFYYYVYVFYFAVIDHRLVISAPSSPPPYLAFTLAVDTTGTRKGHT